MNKVPDELVEIVKEYVYFTPDNCKILKLALIEWFLDNNEAKKKYGDISEWNTIKIINKYDKRFVLSYIIRGLSSDNITVIDFNDKCVTKEVSRIVELIKEKKYYLIRLESLIEFSKSIQDEFDSIKNKDGFNKMYKLERILLKLCDLYPEKYDNLFEGIEFKLYIPPDLYNNNNV